MSTYSTETYWPDSDSENEATHIQSADADDAVNDQENTSDVGDEVNASQVDTDTATVNPDENVEEDDTTLVDSTSTANSTSETLLPSETSRPFPCYANLDPTETESMARDLEFICFALQRAILNIDAMVNPHTTSEHRRIIIERFGNLLLHGITLRLFIGRDVDRIDVVLSESITYWAKIRLRLLYETHPLGPPEWNSIWDNDADRLPSKHGDCQFVLENIRQILDANDAIDQMNVNAIFDLVRERVAHPLRRIQSQPPSSDLARSLIPVPAYRGVESSDRLGPRFMNCTWKEIKRVLDISNGFTEYDRIPDRSQDSDQLIADSARLEEFLALLWRKFFLVKCVLRGELQKDNGGSWGYVKSYLAEYSEKRKNKWNYVCHYSPQHLLNGSMPGYSGAATSEYRWWRESEVC